jgi:putative hydrolase of the HAD superfamily
MPALPHPERTPTALVQFRAFIFDLDNTLVDADAAYGAALRAQNIDPEGPAYQQARALVKRRLGPGHVSARNRLLYFKAMHEGRRVGPSTLLSGMHAYEQHLAQAFQAQWKARQRNTLLAALRQQGPGQPERPCLILTNENTRTQLIKWQAIDPEGALFDGLISSEELGCEKPNPRLFEAALARLQVPADACLMVGDHPLHDIAPALACGMHAAWTGEFWREPAPELPAGVLRLTHLEQLLEHA